MKIRTLLLSIVLMSLAACGGSKKTYSIAVDSSFFPLDLAGKEPNVFAYVNELLQDVALEEKVIFQRVSMNWDNILQGLKEKKYQGMISAMPPLTSNQAKYDFSELILRTGPVLLVRQNQKVNSFKDLNGKAVAVVRQSSGETIMERHPQVYLRFYNSVPDALERLLKGEYDGVLVGYLQAISYIQDLYRGRIKIVTNPLNDDGLRLVTLKGQQRELIKIFDKGASDAEMEKLLEKWNLSIEKRR